MKFHTVAKHFSIIAIALTLAAGCASNSKKEEEAKLAAAAEEAQAEAEATAGEAAEGEFGEGGTQSDLFGEGGSASAEAAARADAQRRASLSGNASGYTVSGGDSLWSIAGKGDTYGNPYAWPLIYKANKSQIKDADLIFPGQNFEIGAATGSEIDTAVKHAKTRGVWSVGEVESTDQEYLAQ